MKQTITASIKEKATKFTLDDIQNFADEFTSRLLHTKYGERFDKCDNIEDDEEINQDWEWLNEKLYDIIDTWTA